MATERPDVVVRESLCKGCGRCMEACPKKAMHLSTEINQLSGLCPIEIDKDLCNNCGLCIVACPEPYGLGTEAYEPTDPRLTFGAKAARPRPPTIPRRKIALPKVEPLLLKGNYAAAIGALLAGCRHFFGYPITPSTEGAELMAKLLPELDGVFLQRFSSELSDPAFLAARDQVLKNVMAAAEKHGRVFAIEYDISGQNPTTLVADLEKDWLHLVDDLGVLKSPRYLHHKGKPVLGLWGFGFSDRPGTPQQANTLIAYFKTGLPAEKQVTLMGGVPREWRKDPTWIAVTRSFDIINPWLVGAFVDDNGANAYVATMTGDIADAKANGREFMPVVFPGFSWKNLNAGPLNQIPRRAGKFYWRQIYNAIAAGSTMMFGAMFDEVDEGTAIYKTAPTAQEMPAQGTFLPLDADGTKLPNDWYLRVANQGGKMLRKEIALTSTLPITPP